MQVPITPTKTGDLPGSHDATDKPPCTSSSPCRKCEIRMILRGQYSLGHQGEGHRCEPLSEAKAEASSQIVKAAVEHFFYGKPIRQLDDAVEKAKIVVKAETSSSAPNISTGRPLVPTWKQASSAIAFKVPFENGASIVEMVPSGETKLDAVPQGMADNMDVVVMQQRAMISALVKQQTMMDAGTIHVALPERSQSDYIPGTISDDSGSEESGLSDKSNQDDDNNDGKSPPKKKVRRGPVEGAPREPFANAHRQRHWPPNATLVLGSDVAPDSHVIGPGQRLQEAAILFYNGKTVHNWDELVTQFKQASERGAAPQAAAPQAAAPQAAAPQAGPLSLSFSQATARARPQREDPRRESLPQEAIGTNSAQFAPTVLQPINRDSQAQLLQEARAHNHRLEQLITQTNERINQLTVIVQLLQRSLQTQKSGFTTISNDITQTNKGIDLLITVTRQLGSATNIQTTELRQMRNEMRHVNGADNADLPSFTP
ncbi:hypothetical protein ACHAPO_000776 [Fusarium lateritium]